MKPILSEEVLILNLLYARDIKDKDGNHDLEVFSRSDMFKERLKSPL